MEIRFRKATPSDVEEACPLIYSAAPEAFDYMFALRDYRALNFLRFAFLHEDGLFGYDNHLIAEVDHEVAGIGAFYSGREYLSLGLGNTKQVFKFYGFFDGSSVFKRCLQIQKVVPPPKKDAEYVADLGVKEKFRGQGIGTAILKRQQEIARSKKHRFYILDVAANNPRAQKLYEALGFRVTHERPFLPSGKPGPNSRDTIPNSDSFGCTVAINYVLCPLSLRFFPKEF